MHQKFINECFRGGEMQRFVLVVVLFGFTNMAFAQVSELTTAHTIVLQLSKQPRVEQAVDTQAVIAWSTNVASSTTVHYGTSPNALDNMVQTPWGSLTHRVVLKNLEPGTTYYFQTTSGDGQGVQGTVTSEILQFKTAPSKQP